LAEAEAFQGSRAARPTVDDNWVDDNWLTLG